MLNYFLGLPMMLVLILSTIFSLSADNLMSLWVFMELNMVSFVGLLMLNYDLNKSVSLKYFLVQGLGSSMFLVSLFLTSSFSSMFIDLLFSSSMVLKLGLAPFHGWMIYLIEEMAWSMIFFLNSIQKLIPLFIIMQSSKFSGSGFIFLSAVASLLGGLWESSLKKILGYSSVLSGGWFLAGANIVHAFSYLFFYTISLGLLVSVFAPLRLNQVASFQKVLFSSASYFLIVMSLFNFSGMPPFSLFFCKISIIFNLINLNPIFLSTLLLSTAGFVYIYLRVSVSYLSLSSQGANMAHSTFMTSSIIWLFLLGGPFLMFYMCISKFWFWS